MRDGQGTVQGLLLLAANKPVGKAASFVKNAFVGENQRQRLSRSTATLGLREGQLGKVDLLPFAREWDKMGLTTPTDFIEAIACDVVGHPKNRVAQAALLVGGGYGIGEEDECPEERSQWNW